MGKREDFVVTKIFCLRVVHDKKNIKSAIVVQGRLGNQIFTKALPRSSMRDCLLLMGRVEDSKLSATGFQAQCPKHSAITVI